MQASEGTRTARDFTKAHIETNCGTLRWPKLTHAIIEAQLKHRMTFAYKLRKDPFDPPMHVFAVDTEIEGRSFRHSCRALVKAQEDLLEAEAVTIFQDALCLLLRAVEVGKQEAVDGK